MQYPFFAAENHVFAEIPEGRVLVDTGSPLSFASGGAMTFGGQTHRVPGRIGSFDAAAIGRLVTGPCVGLIGMDLLGGGDIVFDLPNGVLRVEPDGWTAPANASFARLRTVLGTPVVAAAVNGAHVSAVFDTGAQFGYLCGASLADGLAQDGDIDDYNPVLGEMHSAAWRVPVSLADVAFEHRCGLLDGLGSAMLRMIGVSAVVGCSLLTNHMVALLGSRGRLAICRAATG